MSKINIKSILKFKKNSFSFLILFLSILIIGGTILGGLFITKIYFDVEKCSKKVYRSVEKIPQMHYGLLLGTGKYLENGKQNLYFTNRIKACAELYHAQKIKHILISGDNSSMDYNEPRDMRDELLKLGVKKQDMTLDFAGFRTFDSIIRAESVFNVNSFTIISQQFHCERAIYIAEHHKIFAIGFAADDVTSLKTKFFQSLRESLSRVMAFFDINILNTTPYFDK